MEDNKVLELLVQAVKNIDEKIDKGFDDIRAELKSTNRRIDETNRRIDNLQDEMNRRFDETNREIRNIKSREKHILDIAMNG